jgi:GDP-mannose transporter
MTAKKDLESQAERAQLLQSAQVDNGKMSTMEIIAGTAYCTTSVGMVLVNKAALSSFGFQCPNTLLLYQCVIALVMVQAAHLLKIVTVERLQWRVVKLWLPVNIIFVGMLWTGTMSLKFLSVAMVTVLKNQTNFLVILGDLVLFNRRYPAAVWLTLALMILSAVVGAATDLDYNLPGYLWQFVNCCFTAAYSLHLKTVMQRISVLPGRARSLDEFSMVYYNNMLSIPLVLVLVVLTNEHAILANDPALQNPRFVAAATLSGIVGFFMSGAALWFLSCSTPTTYSLVGSLNKIPLAVLGMLLFHAPTTNYNIASVMVGLVAGTLFVFTKSRR